MRLNVLLMMLIGNPVLLLAQDTSVYHANGSAYAESCNCYTLTREQMFQSGSVWNKHKISLKQSFDFKFNVNLGCKDGDGADGIVFVLQPISTSIGTTGEGLGFGGVVPSIGVAIDTYQNFNQNDPWFDHIAIHRDGDVNHASANNLAGPVQAIDGKDNIEDCQWHTLRIVWDAVNYVLKAQVDGVDRVQTTLDLVGKVFGGDPMVFWGFTGATGGSINHQRFCTSLNAGFTFPAGQNTCFPTAVQFNDNSFSFGSILKWFWDFGDGTIDSVQNPAIHNYPAPGRYEAKLAIMAGNGCISDTFKQTIVMGTKPVADFAVSPFPVCTGSPSMLNDASKVEFGTVSSWTWNVDHGSDVITGNYPSLQDSFPLGTHTVGLLVKTKEGCVSDPIEKSLETFLRPEISVSGPEKVCANMPIAFTAQYADPASPIASWKWQWGDGNTQAAGDHATHTYLKSGKFPVGLYGLGVNGCPATPVSYTVDVFSTHAFAGNDTTAAMGQPLQLNGSGGDNYSWSPGMDLSDPNIANPVATLQHDATYVLTTTTSIGCPTYDTLHIKVYKGPAIYVPSAFSPNNDGHNDRFRFVAAGMSSINYFNVYNRYGQLVYSSVSPEGWDGTFRGQAQATGTYVWVIRGKDYLGADHTYKGTVVLIR